jgi:group II intron reverse transcriptase/maturase
VSGTPPQDVLCSTWAAQVAGDASAPIFQPADQFGHTIQGTSLRYDGGSVPRQVEAYHWGEMTSGGWSKAIWALLAPFALVNVAHWMLPAGARKGIMHDLIGIIEALLRLTGLPLDELYRQLFNPQLYLLAYGRIYSNDGAMTPGVTQETVDGMSQGKIGRIIDAVRHERYRFSPARRVWIPKKNGKLRPLGMPTWSGKLLGEVVRLLLEAYYEPQFSGRSHGFRPGLGCHTALGEAARTWTGTTWFVEGDVADCFGSLDHEIMIKTLAEKIRDNRFLRLMRNMLRAGYLEDWRWNATLSGAPQGGVVSPILSNIYLHRLDDFAESTLIPEYTRGESRTRNKEYERVRQAYARARKKGDHQKARELRREKARLPSVDCDDPGYRRLHYLRYADLCRARHKSAYAESRVMPILVPDLLVRAVGGFPLSA